MRRPLHLAVRAAFVTLAAPSAFALAACDGAGSTPPPPPERSTQAAGVPAAGRPVVADVTWPPADTIDRSALAAMPEAAARAAAASPVPLLVPSRPELLAAPVIVAKEHWASFWARTPEITVSLMATRLARAYDSIPPARGRDTVRGAPAFITQNEGIWTAAWTENGVSYALDVECAAPSDCPSDAVLRQLAADLVYVGGAGAEPAQNPPGSPGGAQ